MTPRFDLPHRVQYTTKVIECWSGRWFERSWSISHLKSADIANRTNFCPPIDRSGYASLPAEGQVVWWSVLVTQRGFTPDSESTVAGNLYGSASGRHVTKPPKKSNIDSRPRILCVLFNYRKSNFCQLANACNQANEFCHIAPLTKLGGRYHFGGGF